MIRATNHIRSFFLLPQMKVLLQVAIENWPWPRGRKIRLKNHVSPRNNTTCRCGNFNELNWGGNSSTRSIYWLPSFTQWASLSNGGIFLSWEVDQASSASQGLIRKTTTPVPAKEARGERKGRLGSHELPRISLSSLQDEVTKICRTKYILNRRVFTH